MTKCGKSLGHYQLAVRSVIAMLQALITLVLVLHGIDSLNFSCLAVCQVWSSATLFYQWRTGSKWMFVARAIPSLIRVGLLIHVANCGQSYSEDPLACGPAWHDVRSPLRVLHLLAAMRMAANAASLILQFTMPHRVDNKHGHEQLWYRSLIRASGIVIHGLRGALKLTLLVHTDYERSDVEVGSNFLRCLLIGISAWSLYNQWQSSGAKRKNVWKGVIRMVMLSNEDRPSTAIHNPENPQDTITHITVVSDDDDSHHSEDPQHPIKMSPNEDVNGEI